MKKLIFFLLIAIILFLNCTRVPVTNRRQIHLLPEYLVMDLSLTTYNDFISKNPPLPTTDSRVQMIKNVGKKMQTSTIGFMNSIHQTKRVKNFKWEFNLIEDKAVNAWCLPGGKIVFYTGILPYTENEAGIATVMGHEIAHAVAKHGNERLSQQLVFYLGAVSLAVAMQQKPEQTRDIFMSVYTIGGTLGILAYSRSHEYEADKIGMVLMAKAGYDPQEAVKFWERMTERSSKGSNILQFISTHPSDKNRIDEMKKFLPTAKKYYTRSF